jgi:hypothetical protein
VKRHARRQIAAANIELGLFALHRTAFLVDAHLGFEAGERGNGNGRRLDRAFADGDEQLFLVVLAEPLRGLLQRRFRELVIVPVQGVGNEIAAEAGEFLASRGAFEFALRSLGAARFRQGFVTRHGCGALTGDDFNDVAVLQRGAQRALHTVDLGADEAVADVGVHCVRKVERGCALRQRNQRPLRCEREHVVGIHFELGVLEEFRCITPMLGDFQQRARRLAGIETR